MSVIDFIIDQMFADTFGLEGNERDLFFSRNQINGGKKSTSGFLSDTFLANAANLQGDDRDFFFATGAEQPAKTGRREDAGVSAGFYDLPEASPEDKERFRQLLKAIKRDQAAEQERLQRTTEPDEVNMRLEKKRTVSQKQESLTDEEYMEVIRSRLASQLEQISSLSPDSEDGSALEEKSRFVFVRFSSGTKRYLYLCPDLSVWEGDTVLVPFGKGNHVREAVVIGTVTCPSVLSPYPIERIKTVIEKKPE